MQIERYSLLVPLCKDHSVTFINKLFCKPIVYARLGLDPVGEDVCMLEFVGDIHKLL